MTLSSRLDCIMIARLVYIIFFYVCLINPGESARILGIFPMPAPSHYFLGNALLRGLAEAGHDITMITPFTDKNPPKNGTWKEIILEELIVEMQKMADKMDFFKMEKENPLLHIFFIKEMGARSTEATFSHHKVQALLKSNEKFDVVIVNQFVNDGVKAFASHFNAHLIVFSNTASNTWFSHLVGNPSLPSFHPEGLLNLPNRMNFFQRLYNTIVKFIAVLTLHLSLYPKQNELIQKYFPNPVDINDVIYNVSLVLANSHVSTHNPQPLVPCIVEIGGFHIKPPKKLPDDLQAYLDDAKDGVIYFSMGSNLKSKNLPVEKRNAILRAFGKRKEKVLWKWEDDVLDGQPPNVRLGKWLPQQEILAHPNVKVFITHGGLLSTIETVYHGVPVIAIPILGDQKMNAYGAEQAGYGIVLPFPELSEETLSTLLEEITKNPKYRENVKERSRIMKDRQVSPLDTAVYWVEYVIRHNGAKHLRVPYLDLAWYEYYLLDVFAFIIAVAAGVIILLRKTFSYLCCRRRLSKSKLKRTRI